MSFDTSLLTLGCWTQPGHGLLVSHNPRLVVTRSSSNCEHLCHTLTTAAMMLDGCGAAANAESGHPPGARRCTRWLTTATRRSARCSWRREPTSRPLTRRGEPLPPSSTTVQGQRSRLPLSHLLGTGLSRGEQCVKGGALPFGCGPGDGAGLVPVSRSRRYAAFAEACPASGKCRFKMCAGMIASPRCDPPLFRTLAWVSCHKTTKNENRSFPNLRTDPSTSGRSWNLLPAI